jgi:hypothetical protein
MTELCPDSIRSNTSCRTIAVPPVGLPAPLSASVAEAALPTKRFRRARPPHHERVARRGACDPPDRPAFAGRPDANRHPPGAKGLTGTGRDASVALSRGARARPARSAILTARAASRLGLRAASHTVPRRAMRSAAPEVPSIGGLPGWTSLDFRPDSPTPGMVFSTVYHQPVESTRRPFHLRGDRLP